ncbi:AAA family ATPase [Nocardioides sp. dk4132]|uniref:AAA family ATPase n=1 Tax=unclassified Nocardioides TaxID=2615069 RepID=UPI0012970CDB|nr:MULTISPECIES: MoxR family ATPase [unclassified Nocardioides]MQW77586.1 AAA family ATPase [Nocardioides sp. dk4132]QGA06114.1 AAA family ATPase [Nocardioides sp. dk884]
MPAKPFMSVEEVGDALRATGYLPNEETSTAVLLATRLGRPLLAEGPAGTGKTALAKALAAATGARIIRLQCHEAIDESRALYEWDYRKQLLAIQSGRGDHDEATVHDVYAEEYLLVRPLLDALRADDDVILLVDEVDRLSVEAEALLLEFMAERQVTVPELGTITARQISPVILTSNNTRELSEALRRRCLYLHLDYPDPQRERDIVMNDVPGLRAEMAEQVATAVATLRSLDLRKKPSVAETLDWAQSLLVLPKEQIDLEAIRQALPLLLKSQSDIELALTELARA